MRGYSDFCTRGKNGAGDVLGIEEVFGNMHDPRTRTPTMLAIKDNQSAATRLVHSIFDALVC